MIETAPLVAGAVTAMAAAIAAKLVRTWAARRQHHNVQVRFKSGERIYVDVGAQANEQEIEDKVKQDSRVRAKARQLKAEP